MCLLWMLSACNAKNIVMLADGNGSYATARFGYGCLGYGVRSKRFAMIVNDGVVELLNIRESGFESSSAEAIITALK